MLLRGKEIIEHKKMGKTMIDTTTRKTAVIIDGKLSCIVGKNKDVFGDSDPEIIKKWEKKIEQARDDLERLRQSKILEVFRTEVASFEEIVGSKPTLALMCYRDVNLIVEAWNQETRDLHADNRPYLSIYNSGDDTRYVDGIHVKKGCDQEPGQIRFYSAE